MCKDVRNSYIVHKLGIQRVPYDIRNYAVMRVFGKMSWGYYAGLRFPKTGHPALIIIHIVIIEDLPVKIICAN